MKILPGAPVHDAVRAGARALRLARIDSARIDAEVLMMHLLDVDRAHLYLDYNEPVSAEIADRFAELVRRRLLGEPTAYLTGHREFMGLDFHVDRRVLVPRPETERLVEWALDWLDRHPSATVAVDVGTGSGAIAVSLARFSRREQLQVIGSDLSRDALDVADDNRRRLAPSHVRLVRGRLLDWCRGPVDLVVANLPYLRPDQAHPGIAFEPPTALFAEGDGFALYAELLQQARRLIRPNGALGCEIDPSQEHVALVHATSLFPHASVRIELDLAGLMRYLLIEGVLSV